jgi:uroporphyrin-III C-methyltransferase/precorrin-2 dehydrogenase/sirohydrochlorin ferrochelatase
MGDLNTFPVSYKVEGQRIVIIGGGEEALNKARLAVKTTALVVIVSRRVEADFSRLPVTVVERAFAPSDLDKAALCFVAEEGQDAEAAKAAARERGIPLNVVDVPSECDFFTPSIIDRAPVTIAVATEGDAPVLARLVRARIEAMLSPNLGKLAALAGAMRDRALDLIPGIVGRRRYFEALVTEPAVEAALARGQGEDAAAALLEQHAKGSP